MHEIYPYFIKFHIAFSVLFLLLAITITLCSFYGWVKSSNYTPFSNKLRKVFLSALYIDLILGIILYFFLQKPDDFINAQQAMKFSSLRFWAIQHFSNMLFVVVISQIGSIFITNTNNSIKKYKYSFIYFGVSTFIIIVSVGLFALRK